MADVGSAIPLIALDAVVLDTETTGLDARKAWIVEVGAVRLAQGRLKSDASFRRLVRPGEPIPALASRIHGIDDAAVAGAEEFPAVWRELGAFIDVPVLLGHSIGFDLAILQRECARAGVPWTQPRSLCTRFLSEVVEPELAGLSLENLAAGLGVEIVDRHTALGDAKTAAGIFLALVPKLRERGIRTLAEAEQACRALTSTLEHQRRAGWAEAFRATSEDRSLQGVDTFPYRHRVRDVMSVPAKFVPPDAPLKSVLDQMASQNISSVFVHAEQEAARRPEDSGIVTERDVLRAMSRHGVSVLAMPVGQIAIHPLLAVPADAFAYLAMARMNRLKIRHLGVTGEDGRIIGALSARDLLRLRFQEAIALGDQIEEAADARELAAAWAKLPQIAASLRADGVSARECAAVISRRLGALTERAAVIAERRMRDAGQGEVPCPYAFAVLGSAGRGESLLAMDQDNALVFAEGAPGGAGDRWFEMFGKHVADILHEAGVPYCKGGVMAGNPQWRGSSATWRERVGDWILRSNPRDLLSVDIFFDLRGVHGELSLADALWRDAFDAAKGQAGFAKLLVEAAGRIAPSLNWFGGIKTEQGRIDLKKAGLFGIVSAARALAICHHVVERSTPARLAGLKALGIGAEHDLDALVDAQETFLDLILAQQIVDIAEGRAASNAVAAKLLPLRDRERLRTALRAVGPLEELTRDLLFRG